MILELEHLTILNNKACAAAKLAGQYINDFVGTPEYEKKGGDKNGPRGGMTLASQVVTEVDQACQEIILDYLSEQTEQFNLGILSEELVDDGSRFDKDYFWCIDPLDGTLPFIEGVPGYCVSIALISKAGVPVVGVVFDPVKGNLFSNFDLGIHKTQSASGALKVVIDRSFLDHELFAGDRSQLREMSLGLGYSGFEVIQYGGAVMNAIHAAELVDACYFKLPKEGRGGGSIWDFGATACLYYELEYFATDIYGNLLDLNRTGDTFMNHRGVLFATTKEISEAVQKLAANYI